MVSAKEQEKNLFVYIGYGRRKERTFFSCSSLLLKSLRKRKRKRREKKMYFV